MYVWRCSTSSSSSPRIPFQLGFHLKQWVSILPPGEHFAVSSEEGPLGGTELETGAGPGERSLVGVTPSVHTWPLGPHPSGVDGSSPVSVMMSPWTSRSSADSTRADESAAMGDHGLAATRVAER